MAIKISAIFHYTKKTDRKLADEEEYIHIKNIESKVFKWLFALTTLDATPTYIFQTIISMNVNKMRQLISRLYEIDGLFRKIKSAIYLFIDSLDHLSGYSNGNRLLKQWKNVQLGLYEATFNVNNRSNAHVKVYMSIRQEVESSFNSSNSLAMSSMLIELKYTKEELMKILNKLCKYYEKKSFNDFVSIESIYNDYYKVEEKVFNYIYRHTVGRPRDFVAICYFLSIELNKEDIDKKEKIREVVNRVSRERIVNSLFDEQKIMLQYLDTIEKKKSLFKLINKNILSIEEIMDICRKYNKITKCHFQCRDGCEYEHPFCELYNLGLLGIIAQKDNGEYEQSFKKPHQISDFENGSFPLTSTYYLIHPALKQEVEYYRGRDSNENTYCTNKYIIVGDTYPWENHYNKLIEVSNIVDTTKDLELKKEMEKILSDVIELKVHGDITKKSNVVNTVKDIINNVDKANILLRFCLLVQEIVN